MKKRKILEYWIIQLSKDTRPCKSRSYRTRKMFDAAIKFDLENRGGKQIKVYYTNEEEPLKLIEQYP